MLAKEAARRQTERKEGGGHAGGEREEGGQREREERDEREETEKGVESA